MLKLVIIILVALAPCVFWLWIIYKRDKYSPEPLTLIIRVFLLGAAVAVPVAIIEGFLYPSDISSNLSIPSALYLAFGVAGVTEEVSKFLVVRLGVSRSRFFEEPSDGLIYASAAALGFAALENIVYLFSFGWQIILIRGLFSNLAHVLFSILWGYPLALYKLGIFKSPAWIGLGILASIVAHGIFDFLLFTGTIYSLLVFPFFIAILIVFILLYRHANRISKYARRRSEEI
jgi:RsiW-degrading membrane proteinase PrsW (M82 family)